MRKNEKLRGVKGITLIALVITIIVLLILAGVSIATLTGQNGILTRANDAKEETQKASLIEQAQTDLLGKQAEKKSGDISKGDLKEILEKYFNDVPEELPDDLTGFELISKEEYGGQTIDISDIWNGEFEKEKEYIETATSYVGYYADIDGNGSVDGIIYADLAIGGKGAWNDDERSIYEYSAVTDGLKEYYVSQTGYEGAFGTKDVLAPEGSGQDRFYVMALEDINTGTQYCWYDAAADDGGKLDNIVESSENDFGQGKTNTADVMEKWKTEKWGAQDDNGSNLDMWGEIEEEVSAGWFVPSKSEWSAFGDFTADLGITSDYGDYGLNHRYWSSSQSGSRSAYYADYYYGGFILDDYPTVTFSYPVRLSTTF